MTTIQYLSLTKPQRFVVNVGNFFKNLGKGFVNFFRGLPLKFMKLGYKIAAPFKTLIDAWKKGSWMVRMNFGIFGFYQITHREIARGVLYLLYEIVFIWFLATTGAPYLAKLGTLGTFSTTSMYLVDPTYGVADGAFRSGDTSFTILLYSLVTLFLLGIFVVLWFFSIRDAKSLQDNIAVGRLSKNSQFFKDLLDSKYHTVLLAVPLVGLVTFTVIPIVFMVITGFTNYNGSSRNIL